MATTEVLWIKLKVGMFDGSSFKKIKRAKIAKTKARDKLTAVWFELLDLCAKCNRDGELIDSRGNALTIDDVATMTDREEKEVGQCLHFFTDEGMVTFENNVYRVTNWAMYQNEGGLEKIRKQKRESQARWRAKQKQDESTETGVVESVDSRVESTEHLPSNSNSNSYNNISTDISLGDKERESEGGKKRAEKAVPDYTETTFSAVMIEAVEAWLKYKRERREPYKPQGLKALISEIQNNVDRYGEQAVIELMQKCMASGWRGIIFDKLNQPQPQQRSGFVAQQEERTKNPFFRAAMNNGSRTELPQIGGATQYARW